MLMKYIPIPKKKGNSRFVHLYDIVLMAVLVYFLIILFPMGEAVDFSAAGGESSAAYARALTEEMEQVTVKEGFFPQLFDCCTLQNGGGIYYISGKDLYFQYDEDGKETGYYPFYRSGGTYNGNVGNTNNVPLGLMTNRWYINVLEDGTVYYDNLEGFCGTTDYVIDTEAEVNYAEITELLTRSETEKIGLKDAARLLYLVRENILIGYSDGMAWFRVDEEDCVWAVGVTAEGVVEEFRYYENIEKILAVDNRYLIFIADGEMWFTSVALNTYKGVGFPESVGSWGKLLDIGYAVDEGQIHFFGLSEKMLVYFILDDETMGATTFQKFSIDYGTPDALYVTNYQELAIWVHYDQDYHYYVLKD